MARLPLSSAKPGRRETTRATIAIAATRAAFTVCMARTPLPKIWGSTPEPQCPWIGIRKSRRPLCNAMAWVSRKTLLWSTRKTVGSRHQLKLRLECDQEASGFAAGHDAMVEGERQRQHTSHRRLAPMRDCPLGNPPRSYDCHLRWHDDQIGKPASDHPEIGQRNGRDAELFMEHRA